MAEGASVDLILEKSINAYTSEEEKINQPMQIITQYFN